MSSREPLWFCHECHAEMRPLMVPDPHCASCNGTFVEKLENLADDPREFGHAPDGGFEDAPFPMHMFDGMRRMFESRPSPSPGSHPGRREGGGDPGMPNMPGAFTIRFERSTSPDGRVRTTVTSGSSSGNRTETFNGRSGDDLPRLSDLFGRRSPGNDGGPDRGPMTGPMMSQYLLAMLGNRPGGRPDSFNDFLGSLLGPGEPGDAESGRWGDYVLNQEALDQIISQIMENSNSHAPVPATEEIMKELPRTVLEEGSPLLSKDCAVCKEQFKLDTEDPDEAVVVTLPCQHPFHEPCIMPWLKSSGTCPVCRYQLVKQPEHHTPGTAPTPGPSDRRDSNAHHSSSRPSSPSARRSHPDFPSHTRSPQSPHSRASFDGDYFGGNAGNNSLFNFFGLRGGPGSPPRRRERGGSGSNLGSPPARPRTGDRSGSGPNEHVPGGWDSQDVD